MCKFRLGWQPEMPSQASWSGVDWELAWRVGGLCKWVINGASIAGLEGFYESVAKG